MSKAVLVLPEMPKGCGECPVCKIEYSPAYRGCFDVNDYYYCCGGDGDERDIDEAKLNTRPDWCHLRPIPEKKTEPQNKGLATDTWDRFYALGWNACLREIEGSRGDDN